MGANNTFDLVVSIADRISKFEHALNWAVQSGDTTKAEVIYSTLNSLNTYLSNIIAGERNPGSPSNNYMLAIPRGYYVDYNPHTATTGTTLTAGSSGNAEAVICNQPCALLQIVFASDCAAGQILLRDTTLTGQSLTPFPVGVNTTQPAYMDGMEFVNGLAAIGSAAGVCARFILRLL